MIDKTQIFEILKTENIPYRNYDHIPVYTVDEANSIDIPGKDKCLKNLFLKDKKGNFYLVSLNGSKSIDLKKLRAFLGSTHLHFAGEDDLYKVTGLRKGHVTPFGILNSRGYDVTAVFDTALAANVKSSLGIGLMVGTGIGIIVKGILPKAKEIFGALFIKDNLGDSIVSMRWAPIAAAVIVALLASVCHLGIIPSLIVILGAWLTTSMSAQCVGQSGINPMEIFGIIILLAAKAVSSIGQTEAFYVAAIIAVACGLVGDVMNDFKSGYILKTDPKKQWIAECIGGYIGALVSVIVLLVILKAYGADAFGGEMFPAAQAGAVAAMVGGISNVPAFVIGLVAAVILYCLNLPVMTLGLGVYLPFYLSATAFVGGLIRFITDRAVPSFEQKGTGSIIAAGLLGGEAIVGVIIALIIAVQIMA